MEDFYRKQSLKGYHLKDCWLHFSEFKKSPPKKYEYFLVDCITNKEKKAAKELYCKNECEYVCSCSNILIFRKDSERITENDIAQRQRQYTKCAKRNMIAIVGLSILLILFIFQGVFSSKSMTTYLTAIEISLCVPLIEECTFLFNEHQKYTYLPEHSSQKISIVLLRVIESISCIASFSLYLLLLAIINQGTVL